MFGLLLNLLNWNKYTPFFHIHFSIMFSIDILFCCIMGITEFMGLNPLISILFCIEKGNKFLFCHIKKYLKITKVNKNDNYIKKKS